MKLILASASPRRSELLKMMGLPFEVRISNADESFPDLLPASEVAALLAGRKADAVSVHTSSEIVISADTVVECEGRILNKPQNKSEAIEMLSLLSGKMHLVHSGFCLLREGVRFSGTDTTKVWFRELEADEIQHYIRNYPVLDKAGSYGIQDWIGLVAVSKIEGSYFTVMGLPTHRIWDGLRYFRFPFSTGITENTV
jgi:septum formation protein